MGTNKLISFFLPLLLFVGVMPIKSSFAGDNPFIGEINYFAGNFAPRGWAFCDGQLLPIASYTALFSLLGTTYGGDGRTTFALPELRGRVVVHQGTGPGISPKTSGEKSGSETVIATTANLPPHNHNFNVTVDNPSSTTPTNRAIASGEIYSSEVSVGALQALHNSSISQKGGGNSMNKMQPSITARCIIALVGTFPSRS
jgi:microcystin-dependent protein